MSMYDSDICAQRAYRKSQKGDNRASCKINNAPIVIPAKAGISSFRPISTVLDPGFRRGGGILQEPRLRDIIFFRQLPLQLRRLTNRLFPGIG